MNILSAIVITLIFTLIGTEKATALTQWDYQIQYESKKIITNRAILAATADINGNGTKEIIITDFSFLDGQDIDHNRSGYNLYVLEWRNDQLYVNYHKNWKPMDQTQKRFMAFKVMQLLPWKINGAVTVETLPPYFALQWGKGKYILQEQVWAPDYKNTIGSWALPWIGSRCYGFGKSGGPERKEKVQPYECLLGIRDFAGDGNPKIASMLVEEIIKGKEYKQTLRVRSLQPGFPIEWQMVNPDRFVSWKLSAHEDIDLLNWKTSDKLLLFGVKNMSWYFVEWNKAGQKYVLNNTKLSKRLDIRTHGLPYIYLRATQRLGVEEYWGYQHVRGSDKHDIPVLGKDVLRPDLTGFDFQNIEFEHHEPYLGVTHFDARDIDDDGIDEVVLVERTGNRKFGEETVSYSNVKEYIHILKWNGQAYQTMWVSSPYTKIGTKFLVDDIKNTGKKQLVVMTPYGTIQIWEKQ